MLASPLLQRIGEQFEMPLALGAQGRKRRGVLFYLCADEQAVRDVAVPDLRCLVQEFFEVTPDLLHRALGKELIEDAQALADAGCFSIVLEAIPSSIAEMITEAVPVPTIGIGAGASCDGQVLVIHDVLGLFDRFIPRFVKQYAKLGEPIIEALTRYREEVEKGIFPGPEHGFVINEKEIQKLSDKR
jgi:hypothetical protein